jgi:PhnB protein
MNAANRSNIATAKLSTMLSVRNGARAVEFYKTAFGAEVLFRIGEGNEPVVAQLAMGTAEFWVADESPQHYNFSPDTLTGSTMRMIVVVDNPDELFSGVVAAGAQVLWPVENQSYGWRVGRLVDPFGHHWEIGKPLQ